MINNCTFQPHIIFLNQHVLVTSVTTIRVSCNKNTIKIQIIVQKCAIKPLDFSVAFHMVIRYKIILSLKYSQIGCVYVVFGYIQLINTLAEYKRRVCS